MTVVSSKEFLGNEAKYFDLALDEQVMIKRGDNMFQLIYAPVEKQYPEQPICEDNSDLETAITGGELRKRLHRRIHAKFATRV
jgi:hypothetical protein